jgi:N-acetylglutamate synthase-like GNAT family acetyltransferase
LGSLFVDPYYQKQGIGKMLINATMEKAKKLGFKTLYLFTFDSAIQRYYEKIGWSIIGMDEFKGCPVIILQVIL